MEDVNHQPTNAVASRIEENSAAFLGAVLDRLHTADALAHLYLPGQSDRTHVSLCSSLSTLISTVADRKNVDRVVLREAESLATDYRRFGMTPEFYLLFSSIIQEELRKLCTDLSFEEVFHAERAVEIVFRDMAETTRRLDLAGVPASTGATVAEVERRSRRFSVVRLVADRPLDYRPGQYMAVTADFLPNVWRFLCPSIPPNQWGQVEFHVQSDADSIATLLASTQPGDRWRIGNGLGNLSDNAIESGAELLLVGFATGLAPLRSIMLEIVNRPNPPRVHFFVGAEYPGELYELMGLWNFAAACPWLSVVPVVTHEIDEWWVQATEASRPPRGLHLVQVGSLADAVTSYGTWSDREVLIAGPAEKTEGVRDAMIARGTPPGSIRCLSF
ncbi:2-polyprenylphenol hydroxylase [Corynebacterium pacaense]|uniref:2-polyprenylphenol hydroxylase n=1 Tax=Corynebacterium pacaense TaxID=1816684 RepID=UPI0009BACA4C|nr:2-polyprenylphenol hydroxylase [Corynebacterium pacaense]